MYIDGQYYPKDLKSIEETCNATPIPTLTNIVIQQRGYLSIKNPKTWKQYIAIHHPVRKNIYIIKNTMNWHTHPIITILRKHNHKRIPPPLEDDLLQTT